TEFPRSRSNREKAATEKSAAAFLRVRRSPELPMQLADFAQAHLPALERDEVRHNLIVAIVAGAAAAASSSLRFWTLGAPGGCAVQSPARAIVVCAPDRAQCAALAEETRALDNAGVVGPDQAANWFADRAAALG